MTLTDDDIWGLLYIVVYLGLFFLMPYAMGLCTLFCIIVMPTHNGEWWIRAYWDELDMNVRFQKFHQGAHKFFCRVLKWLPMDILR